MEKPPISFFAMSFAMLFAVISFILVVFDLHRFAFVLELGVLLILIFLIAFSIFVVYHGKRFGWTILGAALVLLLIDIFFIYLVTGTFDTAHLTAVVFSLIGIGISIISLRESREKPEVSGVEEHEKAKDYYHYIDKMEPEAPNIEKTFIPGKFVASRNASKFHSPKCDWAKKIGRENQVWFNSQEEAESKGFEADKCVA